ncbi:MAG: amino acid adenylation domain-containing protein, partial [Gemmatimonadetes bacterium]|nr:amino acid adenylation domain-containing protein [Gemmatimonadota bacterium]
VLLDGGLQPVPLGVVGELYLSGDGLARGYANRPDLTAERFLPDPFGEPGGRMYRVMDRVRWRADGELEYFGRTDFQVKVRGFRIELGEIETALRAHEALRDAVVLVREDVPGDRRLVAYVVAGEGMEAPDAGELRTWLRRRVPEYMVPGAFVALPELPLTPNGKVDRRALPAPDAVPGEAEHAPPRTPVEAALAEIFARVLNRERVGIHDSFFDLGGHSLLATRVTSHARETFGVEVPLRAVFEAPTVAALAEHVETTMRTEEEMGAHEGAAGEAEANGGGEAAAGGSAALDRLSPERLLLLRKWRMERAASQRIPRRAGNGPAPLSFAQQRLWFIHQLDPRSSAYNMPFALRLRGVLDVPALQRSLTELVRRHEAVRTALVDQGGGEAVQVILPAAPVPFPVVDLTTLPEQTRRAETLRRVREEGQHPFDLTRGPLLRALLIRMGPEEWALCFTMHHIISDGWSMGVLTREISALYEAYSRGAESPLPELPVQYADFATWQRERLTGDTLEAQLAYWRERLAGAPPILELPTDHPRRTALGVSEKGRRFILSPEATQALRELARAEGATLFMALLAAWQTLLGRYASQDDVVVGTPIANRTRAELEPLIGFFVNTLVLRGELSGDPSFRELLGRARETTLGAYQHQDLPFERLVEELAPERSLMHNPLFQVMFTLQNMDRGALALGDVEMEALAGGESGAKFDIGVTLSERDDLIAGNLTYRTDLFDASTMDRMAEHFRLLLEAAVVNPDRPISELRLIGPAEEHQLLAEWNAPRAYPTERLVPHLFAEQAACTPDAPAAWDGDRPISYAELDRRSSRLAHALRALGVAGETPVGVCLERDPDLLVAVLGVWKAGGAYVPLDPSYPPERLAYLLQDAAVPVLVSRERLREALPPHDARLLLLDADAERIAGGSDRAPEVALAPEGLAYVIYTSGSTGRPKGVRVTHGSLLHTLRASLEAFGFRGDDVVPSLASFSFDIWLFESILPLLAGGSVRVLPREEVLETEQLVDTLAGCTALHAVPALMRQIALVLRASGRTLPRMRQVFVGGDAVAPDLLEEMREVFATAVIHVLYGPTEGTIICASHEVREAAARRQWVGHPLGNATLYVVDRALQPVPVGVPGELCIGGASVARDYLGRPELTADKFQPDPFAGAGGARMYRTGDRVRWTADGELEFLGRVDTQVKIRGFRIEPGEIENVLLEHDEVQEAVVLVREDTPGDRRLVGYVVPADEGGAGAPQAEFQREHVQQWESLFGDTYGGHAADEDPAFNIVGWNSSYTGEPIPDVEMREWVEHAADRIRALRPRRVLEIGCGTGLLLFRVAPETEEYWGADFAATAIAYLRAQLDRPGRELPQVTLLERTADDFTGIPEGYFDLVVIN